MSHGHAKIGMLSPGLIVGGWFYWTFLAFHSGAVMSAAERLMTTTSPQKARAINPLS